MADHRFVASLPDLIDPAEYDAHPDGGLIRLRITVTDTGVEVLGDGMRPEQIEAVLDALNGPDEEGPEMEQMLCG
ncbi:hypothetical protein GCM10009555_019820 [Acrocarpospora macrocephala]|uniref:Uncharacterized protein n=1 Tax=Acrocarpospora macrocephala TaxID=150177 RepID=A0A5M3WP12_9ACTN|nr:radical SAM-modified peptide, FtsH ternary system-associated [Acrocarpospora macrocephala]GES08018.1 hypothetical protein Amac_016130 [Acrocarpospora macrocephala]